MSIETNIERIASALEKLVSTLEARPVAATGEAADVKTDTATKVAAETVAKAATKGRSTSRKKPAEPAPEPAAEAPAEDPAPATEPEPAESNVPAVADVQKRAARLAAQHGKEAIFELIGRAEGANGKISGHSPEQLVELMGYFDELEAEGVE